MRAFIIRPFGIKNEIDFDRIEQDLIQPALAEAGIVGATTGEILAQGNIRSDMFERLVAADLVIVDMTLNNPNVFYELGIRHGLQARGTILLRGRRDGLPEVPFDLKTDRYHEYNLDAPQESCSRLASVIVQSRGSDKVDSPVYQLLPTLARRSPAELQRVPTAFSEAVRRAKENSWIGDLELLGGEIRDEIWESEGLRRVGRALRGLRAFESARRVWERVRFLLPGDLESDLALATILQRLGDLPASNIVVERALANPAASFAQKAELSALGGSNLKTSWLKDWQNEAAPESATIALCSPFLTRMASAYRRGLLWDPSHYYAGINALAAVTLHCELARAYSDCFRANHDTSELADQALAQMEQDRDTLRIAVGIALESSKQRDDDTRWLLLTRADLALLQQKRAGVVESLYNTALANADWFDLDALDRQLGIYEALGLFADAVTGARAALERAKKRIPRVQVPERVVVFTGHRVDSPGRKQARFPPSAEPLARELIRERFVKVIGTSRPERLHAYAGGANGGDILFLELCRDLGVPATILLAVPRNLFVPLSVASPTGDWVPRLNALLAHFPSRILGPELAPPSWLTPPEGSEPRRLGWIRNGQWILNQGLGHGAHRMTLIALWNGIEGDGSGGTADLVEAARARGAHVEVVDSAPLIEFAENASERG